MHVLDALLVVPVNIPTSLLIGLGMLLGVAFVLQKSRQNPAQGYRQRRSRWSGRSEMRTEIFRPTHSYCPDQADVIFKAYPYLLTKGEHAFLPALEQAVAGEYRIAMKVRLGDLVAVIGTGAAADAGRGTMQQMHVDFVLCDHYPVKPRLVIELDDRTHNEPHRQWRDAFVDRCLSSAGLPILHQKCMQAYDVTQLAQDIRKLISEP